MSNSIIPTNGENNTKIFNHEQFGKLRVVVVNGEPWFVAADVCRVLDIGNTAMALSRLDEDEKGVSLIDTLGGKQDMSVVSEPGLYSLALGSRKPEAKPFKRWVTHDVIPSIRQTGMYLSDKIDSNTLFKIAQAMHEKEQQIAALEEQKAVMQPKADYFDALVDRNLLTNFRETAKQLHTRQNQFVRFLMDSGYVYRDNRGRLMPYAQHAENGLFEVKECLNGQSQWCGTQTLVTPKGRETFRLLLEQ